MKKLINSSENNNSPISLRSYMIGGFLSLLLTLVPYYLVVNDVAKQGHLLVLLALFATLQIVVQLVFFLHITHESKPRWNLLAFLFMLLIVVIVVLGSIWIMSNLDYNMMNPGELNEQLLEREGIRAGNG